MSNHKWFHLGYSTNQMHEMKMLRYRRLVILQVIQKWEPRAALGSCIAERTSNGPSRVSESSTAQQFSFPETMGQICLINNIPTLLGKLKIHKIQLWHNLSSLGKNKTPPSHFMVKLYQDI
jgi:hypothetical protein